MHVVSNPRTLIAGLIKSRSFVHHGYRLIDLILSIGLSISGRSYDLRVESIELKSDSL